MVCSIFLSIFVRPVHLQRYTVILLDYAPTICFCLIGVKCNFGKSATIFLPWVLANLFSVSKLLLCYFFINRMAKDIDQAFGTVIALQLLQSSGSAVSLLLQIAVS